MQILWVVKWDNNLYRLLKELFFFFFKLNFDMWPMMVWHGPVQVSAFLFGIIKPCVGAGKQSSIH